MRHTHSYPILENSDVFNLAPGIRSSVQLAFSSLSVCQPSQDAPLHLLPLLPHLSPPELTRAFHPRYNGAGILLHLSHRVDGVISPCYHA